MKENEGSIPSVVKGCLISLYIAMNTEALRMSIVDVTNKKMLRRSNCRQQALLERKHRKLRRQAFIARRRQIDSSVNNLQKEKPTMILLYVR